MSKRLDLAAEIREYCQARADPKQAAKYARYFKEGYDGWGIAGQKDHPLWTTQQEDWLKRYSALGLRGFLALGDILFAAGKYEEGALTIRFVARYRDEFDAKLFARLGKWFEAGIGNWAHTDMLCAEIIAPLIASGQIELKALAPWREALPKYQRRAVPVGMLDLVKTGRSPGAWLRFLRPMMMDAERVVHQGLGWFLREAWRKHPTPVEAYLMEWKDRAPRLIYQYATEKMSKQDRERFRRRKTGR